MNRITFPLNPGMTGEKVADLQDGLQLLLKKDVISLSSTQRLVVESGLRNERSTSTDGQTTGQLVRLFQQGRNLPPDGTIGEGTAKALNDTLEELGAFRAETLTTVQLDSIDLKMGLQVSRLTSIDTQLGAQTTQLTSIDARLGGQTTQLGSIDTKVGEQTTRLGSIDARLVEQTKGLGGLDSRLVEQTSRLGGIHDRLGEHSSRLGSIDSKLGNLGGNGGTTLPLALEARGAEVQALQLNLGKLGFSIPQNELDEQVFGFGTQDALRRFQTKQGLGRTGKLDDLTRAILDRVVTLPAPTQYRLEGRLYFQCGTPASGVTLSAWLHRAGRLEALGTTQTDAQGFYALSYPPPGRAASIELRIVDPDHPDDQAKDVSLCVPKRVTGPHLVMNLIAPSSHQRLAPELERLTTDLSLELDGLDALGELREDLDRQDLALLHEATHNIAAERGGKIKRQAPGACSGGSFSNVVMRTS